MTTSEAFKLWRVALEAICATECAWVGSYKNCAEARGNPNETEFDGTCPKCIAEDALLAWQYRREPLRNDAAVRAAVVDAETWTSRTILDAIDEVLFPQPKQGSDR